MALITCVECGKKVSDTVQRCVHCGAPIALSIPAEQKPVAQKPVEQKPVVQKPVEQKPKVAAPKDYYAISEGKRIQLEADFLSRDAWADKFRKKALEAKALSELFLIATGLLALGNGIFMPIAFRGFGHKIQNQTAVWVYLAGVIGGVVVFSVLSKIFSSLRKRREADEKKYIYMKKYQAWLLKEKNIRYDPVFVDDEEKRCFEAVNLQDIQF